MEAGGSRRETRYLAALSVAARNGEAGDHETARPAGDISLQTAADRSAGRRIARRAAGARRRKFGGGNRGARLSETRSSEKEERREKSGGGFIDGAECGEFRQPVGRGAAVARR